MEDKLDVPQIRDHRRQWHDCLYVYPVIARRSKGLSIGVNLNPDRRCTFGCVYCQVDRSIPRGLHQVHLPILHDELQLALTKAATGQLWQEERFASTPDRMRRVNDIAFSGDGEPTCLEQFDQAVVTAASVKNALSLDSVKLVVITNATRLTSPQVLRALPTLDANNGEIWAKLDAGTQDYFQRVNRPAGGLQLGQIVQGIQSVAVGRPIVIQSLFMRLAGQAPPPQEIDAYCGQIAEILHAGGKIKLIQVHTVARTPAEADVAPLSKGELDAIAKQIRAIDSAPPVETYEGAKL